MYQCTDDPTHQSATPEVCSVCGALIAPVTPVTSMLFKTPMPKAQAPPGETCTNCGVPRRGTFCENCGFDFVVGTAEPADAPALATTPSVAGAYKAIVTVDLGPRERTDDAHPPSDHSTQQFILDRERLLIGRGSASVHPDIVIREDSGISRGHAELIRDKDGSYAIRDLDSANGTSVNDKPLQGAELRPVRPGDRIIIGFWHTITLEKI